jgi:hypothetical protein
VNENVLSTLRARQATVAEAFAGFCAAAAAFSSPHDGGGAALSFSARDTRADAALAHTHGDGGGGGGGGGDDAAATGDDDAATAAALHRAALLLAAPVMSAVSIDWVDDWAFAVCYAARSAHPLQVAALVRFVLSNAVAALDPAESAPPPGEVALAAQAALAELCPAVSERSESESERRGGIGERFLPPPPSNPRTLGFALSHSSRCLLLLLLHLRRLTRQAPPAAAPAPPTSRRRCAG